MENLENSLDVTINPLGNELKLSISGRLSDLLREQRGTCPNCGNPMSTSRCDTCS